MLTLYLDTKELYDEATNTFVYTKPCTLKLEHSLVSLSKWESKWHKPFLGKTEHTPEELLDYVRCMCITEPPKELYLMLDDDALNKVIQYIDDPHTATTIKRQKKTAPSRELITSELIYYWMVALQIPPEYQKWHLNRLITLIEVCSIKNTPPKKMSRRELLARNHAINEKNKKFFGTKG